MKIPAKLFLALVFFLTALVCNAQQKVLRITDSLFANPFYSLILSEQDGWYFRPGHNDTWAKELPLSGWKELKPAAFPQAISVVNQKAEAWFRIRIHLDSNLKYLPSGLMSGVWAASEVYIDGRLAISFGETGHNGMPYREHRPFWKEPFHIDLKPGKTYTLAIHVVDYTVPLNGGSLKSADGFGKLLVLTTQLTPAVSERVSGGLLFTSVLFAITGVIGILFWFFWLLNTGNKSHLLFAMCSSFISLCILNVVLQYASAEISFDSMRTLNVLFSLCMTGVQLLIFIILTNVLSYKGGRWLSNAIYTMIAVVLITSQLPGFFFAAAFTNILFVIACVFVVVKSWKSLKGAQWSIVAGLLSAITFATLSFGAGVIIPSLPLWASRLIYAIAVISFPLGLMIYAAIRFSEINRETALQASKLIQLSEEKKQQAVQQQRILEEEVQRQTADLRKTLDDLKKAQNRLIQSEKMASLGELMAGIAHEIQNPLNFVNNFSETNIELIEDMEQEIDKLNIGEVKAIASDLKENEQKINRHGKRADAVVKGMLQHSRTTKGEKQPTDINALTDEYLRLAYHGLRAKDKDFNANLTTHFDEGIGKIEVAPQDIGRVLLNLYNNAFYAVNEKKKQLNGTYEPTVEVSTKRVGDKVEVSVRDNGVGIPQKVLDKIYQPFFTTKPTGQGTGLGLSLGYDIITKGHGGELKVETREGEYAEFIVTIPYTIAKHIR